MLAKLLVDSKSRGGFDKNKLEKYAYYRKNAGLKKIRS